MATTTNYGWTTPDDTALVKDGASAIRTLGSSVDTTTKNLNPETTLGDLSFRSSTSNVNTRIPIGSSGQHLTVVAGVPAWATASDQTPLTTKGDLLGFSTLDARIPIGTNGHILTADSTESLGLKWAAPSAGGFVGVRLTKSAVQSLANNTGAKITWDTETYDTNTFHDPSTNTSRITIPAGKAGYYSISATGAIAGNSTGQRYYAYYINGVYTQNFGRAAGFSADTVLSGTLVLNLAVADYIEVEAFQNSGGALDFQDGANSQFSAQYLGA